MRIRVNVNQSESIRRGFNCNSSVALDINVALLHPNVREFISTRFYDGWIMRDPITYEEADKLSHNKLRHLPIIVPQPNLDGFIEALRIAMGSTWIRFKATENS